MIPRRGFIGAVLALPVIARILRRKRKTLPVAETASGALSQSYYISVDPATPGGDQMVMQVWGIKADGTMVLLNHSRHAPDHSWRTGPV